MATVRVTGIKQVQARLRNLSKAMERVGSESVRDAMIAGQNFARAIAPVDTGAMIKAIRYTTRGFKKRNVGILSSNTPNNQEQPRRPKYHVIMHENPTLRNWRGDPQFMRTTHEFLKESFPRRVREKVVATVNSV